MRTRWIVGVLAVALLWSTGGAWAAPCATACKDEIAACASAECQGLRPRALRHCRRIQCRKPILTDCYHDLAVCGATRAFPPGNPATPPSAGGW